MNIISISLRDSENVVLDTKGRTDAFFARQESLVLDKTVVEQLKTYAKDHGGGNVRFCLHTGPESLFQQMIIMEQQGNYYRPHKHLSKGEAFHMIEGVMGVFLFDDNGEVSNVVRLDPAGNFIFRVGTGIYHAVMPLTSYVVYHECKPGPFLGNQDSIWAHWAPDGCDTVVAEAYSARLKDVLNRHAVPPQTP